MIPPALIDKIRRLVATRCYSLRQIARTTGVSRGTVAAIARGKRPDRQPAAVDEFEEEPLGPIERCALCGALGHAPCRACAVRSWQRVHRRRRPAPGAGELPELAM